MAEGSGLFDFDDPGMGAFLFALFFWIVCMIVWHYYKLELLTVLRYLREAELFVTGLFIPEHKACFMWAREASLDGSIPSQAAYKWAQVCFAAEGIRSLPQEEAVELYNITSTSIGVVGGKVASIARWPASAALLWMIYFSLFKSKRNWFKTTYTLESFIRIQSKMWPVILPIVNFIPSKFSARIPGEAVPDKLPPMAEPLSPEEWVSFHRIPVTNGIPDRDAVRRAMLLQLGPRWTGEDCLTMPQRALLAAFALKGVQKREASDEFLGEISKYWTIEKGLALPAEMIKKIDSILSDPDVGERAFMEAGHHAYRTTALLGVLKWARAMGGVLAPAQFLWLRAVDRVLWYALNNLGRRAFHSEGAGALAHYMAELGAQKPLVVPRLDTAIVTLNQYLSRDAIVIPPREGSAMRKRK